MRSTTTPPPTAGRQSPGNPQQQRSSTRPRRNYQACIACKEQKIRCQLGSPDDPQPPCARCRRSRLDCVFGPPRGAVRGTKRKRARGIDDDRAWLIFFFFFFWSLRRVDLHTASTESHLGPRGDPAPSDVPSVGVHAPTASADASNGSPAVSDASRGDGNRPVPVHFGHAAASSATLSNRDQPSLLDASAIENELRSRDLSDWSGFQLCREGWISPIEAEFLLQWYIPSMLLPLRIRI